VLKHREQLTRLVCQKKKKEEMVLFSFHSFLHYIDACFETKILLQIKNTSNFYFEFFSKNFTEFTNGLLAQTCRFWCL